MFETKQVPFVGIRFVLLGFDTINQNEVRSKLVNGGGVDVGQYSQNCTHVIVDRLVYDDSVCVAARRDGKTLVTRLWVDHSFDIGAPVDSSSVLYRPLKDLNGILGAKSLIMCLTGYQRQDRDDIMTMVGLMGAQFSKPLVANKVTHLICYKFEGEKYELAKKMKKIKLVNHQWLEDCLGAWEILPEDNYNKSGYELEIEAEAKDSEDEAETIATKQFRGRNANLSPCNLQMGMPRGQELATSVGEVSKIPLDTTAANGPQNVSDIDILFTGGKDTRSDQPSSLHNFNKRHPEAFGYQNTGALRNATHGEPFDPSDRTPISTKVANDLASTSRSAKRSPHSVTAKLSTANEDFGYQNTDALGDATCGELSDPSERTPISTKMENDMVSASRSAKRSAHSDVAKLSTASYSRKNPRKLSIQGGISSNVSSSPIVQLGELKVGDGFDISPSKVEQTKGGITSGCVKTPLKGTDSLHEVLSGILPQKRKMDGSCAGSNSKMMSNDSKPCIYGSPLIVNRIQGLEPIPLINGPVETHSGISPSNNLHPRDVTLRPNSAQNSPAKEFRTKSSSIKKKSLKHDLYISKTVTSGIEQNDNAEEKAPQASIGKLEESSLVSKPAIVEKSHIPANLELPKGENDSSLSKPLKKMVAKQSSGSRSKTVAKKSLGSRPKYGTTNTAYQKGSIHFNRTAPQNDFATCSIGGKEKAKFENSSSNDKLEVSPPAANVESAVEMKKKIVRTSGNVIENGIESMDDETEAPEDRDEVEFEKAINEKSEVVELTHKADAIMEEKSEGGQPMTGKSEPDLKREICDKKIELGEPTFEKDAASGKITKGKKCTLGKTKIKNVPDVTDNMESKKGADGEESQNEKNSEKTQMEEERVPHPTGETLSSTVLVNKLKNSMEAEKENRPIINGDQNVGKNKTVSGKSKQRGGKVAVKSNKTAIKTEQKTCNIDPDTQQVAGVQMRVKTQPMWFILSGHRLQRREFQKVISSLKGKFCRDSHHWSYQATHFIVPDPIRRTEKFFAAVASGRWVLKTDYLTASSQAVKFLAEEPYEWHKNGLSEDGAINLEAPRKWRLLREKTGHGAFYGMRIIIYGECIAPPLDTLKRVVKAGDGTILATSPPYTRFLNSGVDFAIVSPGMPRVDVWVQEFLRHEIPCVVADYLVEYVCKPGYSLERHVQYNTHIWAEKSFTNLLSRSEEIVEDSTPPDDHDCDDLACQVCGASDRGEVMLICGDESGSMGCGVGTHIDCCDPSFEEVPEEDWFCSKCSKSRNSSNSLKNTKKRTSSKSK